MRAEAASGEAFGPDGDTAASLHSVGRSRDARGMARKRPFSYYVKRFALHSNQSGVRISGVFKRARREMEEPEDVAPQAASSGRINRKWQRPR